MDFAMYAPPPRLCQSRGAERGHVHSTHEGHGVCDPSLSLPSRPCLPVNAIDPRATRELPVFVRFTQTDVQA